MIFLVYLLQANKLIKLAIIVDDIVACLNKPNDIVILSE